MRRHVIFHQLGDADVLDTVLRANGKDKIGNVVGTREDLGVRVPFFDPKGCAQVVLFVSSAQDDCRMVAPEVDCFGDLSPHVRV